MLMNTSGEFGLRARQARQVDAFGERIFAAIDTCVQIGASREEEVMLSTMWLDKEETEGLHKRLGEILKEWPADRRWDKQTGEPVEPASKEAR